MEENKKISRKREQKSSKGSRRGGKKRIYSYEHKLKAVKIYLEEQYPIKIISQEMGMSTKSLYVWVQRYREQGEAGLKSLYGRSRQSRVSEPVKSKIIEIKKRSPLFGVKRISQILRRIFFLQASPETVRKTLHKESLIESPRKKRQKNINRPRFFERSTPNQLWQTDIFTFRLGGKNAYLIGYIDDYSRYITAIGLFRSQTAEHVLEVFRIAASEYRPPKEMLTDNGRQYTNWRGRTRFEAEMQKERIKHIKSRPHHPMTLGKIERFWKTIFSEFLSRVQFGSFEEAQDRLRLWIKYYNHRRPHQGIGGLCPADRYFEIAHELKKTIETGIEENILEMSLRGKPRDPFYMVGRMDGQSVVIKAEKGKVKMQIQGEKEDGKNQEIEYNIEREKENKEAEQTPVQRNGKMPGGPVNLERSSHSFSGMPGPGDKQFTIGSMAAPGARGDGTSIDSTSEPGVVSGVKSSASRAVGKENTADAEKPGESHKREIDRSFKESSGNNRERNINEQRKSGSTSLETRLSDTAGALRPDNSDRGGERVGDIAQELLQMGEKRPSGVVGESSGSAFGSPCLGDRPDKGTSSKEYRASGAGSLDSSSAYGDSEGDVSSAGR